MVNWIHLSDIFTPFVFQKNDSLVEQSNTGRPKRKGREDINYKLSYSENIDEEELQDFFFKRDNRFAILELFQ